MTHIVAFTGKRGSGKDTAALALKDFGYEHMHFADPLREILMIVYGLTEEELSDPVLKERVLDRFPWRSPRDLMTTIGTQGFRDLIHQETWVRALERRALQHERVVVSDLRFLTEEAMLKAHDAMIIRIVNPNNVKNDETSQHRSETEMDLIVPHHTIINNGTIEDLHNNVRAILALQLTGFYRLKAEPVRAVQWNRPGDHPAVFFAESMGGQSWLSDRWAVKDHEGRHHAVNPGDWLLEEAPGKYRFVPKELFDHLYEAAD